MRAWREARVEASLGKEIHRSSSVSVLSSLHHGGPAAHERYSQRPGFPIFLVWEACSYPSYEVRPLLHARCADLALHYSACPLSSLTQAWSIS